MTKLHGFFDMLVGPYRGMRGVTIMMTLAVVGNIIATILILLAKEDLWGLLAVVAAAILGLVAIYLRPRSEGIDYVTERERPDKYEGLIVLVSKGRIDREPMDQSAGSAIKYHADATGSRPRLKHCWLIATTGPEGSYEFALRLSERCKELGIEPHVEAVKDKFGIQETYDLVRQIYAEAKDKTGLEPHQIISDFTGGVKPMSVGMVLACGDRYPMQYMYGGKPPIASAPRKIEFKVSETGQESA